MINKKGLYSVLFGGTLIAGGAAWRQNAPAEASELWSSSTQAPRSADRCRAVCLDFKILCMRTEGGACVEHKEICVSAEKKCDLIGAK